MAGEIKVVLFGMGGYGETYLRELMDGTVHTSPARLVGLVDPTPPRTPRRTALERLEIPLYRSGEAFFAHTGADLAIVSSPIHWHRSQTCLSLAQGCDVLCEKPAAAAVEDVDAMALAEEQAGRWVAVGYQWSFAPSIQRLKRDIRNGRFGRARRFKSLCLWPRDQGYYRRNGWAGKRKDLSGRLVLDSPLSNAMAHDLHNMLFLLGGEQHSSATPVELTAELYRANPIETFDTAALRARSRGGAEILFFGSHAVAHAYGPVFHLEFDRAEVIFEGGEADIVARLDTGEELRYPSPALDPQVRKLWWALGAAGRRVRPPCGLAAARSHVRCVAGALRSCPEARPFPEGLLRVEQGPSGPLTWVEGLAATLGDGYRRARLPAELQAAWARCARTVTLVPRPGEADP